MSDGDGGLSNAQVVFVGLSVVVIAGWCILSRRINSIMRSTGLDRRVFGNDVVDSHEGIAGKCMTMLYGKLPPSQVPQVGMLSGILFCIIGVYWLLRSLKDTVFASTVGIQFQPRAKMVSLGVVFVLLFVYNKMIDLYEKHVLFYILSVAYGSIFIVIALVLHMPGIGLDNVEPDPSRLIGWVSYCAIESFGSIFVSLFWSFVNSTVSLEHAKASYGLIIAGAQIGAILGPTLAVASSYFGVANLYMFSGVVVGMIWVLMRKFVAIYGTGTPRPNASAGKDKGAPGLVEGVYLLGKHPYVLGIFLITSLFEVVVTVLDFEMKSWSDVFGSRGAKAFGPVITDRLRHSMSALLFYGNLASIVVNAALLLIAVAMGRKFNELHATGEIVGAEPGVPYDDKGASELRSLAASSDDDDEA
ncbi:hypothetical protein T492DRAFT_1053051 [Pavlovales sp. CCMP2436]|nr:hypothetical protein T492DRAFT_1053051 [Pavlovales sp. CCMP2436]